jgi:hypothetical protein
LSIEKAGFLPFLPDLSFVRNKATDEYKMQ